MNEELFSDLEKLFLALSDKTRLRLVALMADGEVSVGFLADALGESQPKISRHLAYLRSTGLVSTRRDGKWIYYGIDQAMDAGLKRVLDTTLGSILGHSEERALVPYEPEFGDWAPAEMPIYLL